MSEPIQPIVLAGGRSRRFGRDKLREPLDSGEGAPGVWLIDRPIGALRMVFGARVAVVGRCDPLVAARADLIIADRYPGVGPIGGIVSALESSRTAIFVLPGDLPAITPGAVQQLLDAAAAHPHAWAIIAQSERPEPCIGLYRPESLPPLHRQLEANRYRLWDALPAGHTVAITLPAASLRNANTPEDLRPGEHA